jgi:hypothetical protein
MRHFWGLLDWFGHAVTRKNRGIDYFCERYDQQFK